MKNEDQELIEAAKGAAEKAYAPYSGFKVGAAVRTITGGIYTGCNIENASYSLTVCAERNAIAAAIMDGEKGFTSIAIFVDAELSFPPCGACRQVLSEFSPGMKVIYVNQQEIRTALLKELLPDSFRLKR